MQHSLSLKQQQQQQQQEKQLTLAVKKSRREVPLTARRRCFIALGDCTGQSTCIGHTRVGV